MKVLFVTPYFPPHIGGTQQYVFHIAEGLSKIHGWKVVVVTANTLSKHKQREEKDGLTIYRLPFLFTFSNTPIHPGWYFSIKKIIRDEKPDIINAHAPVPYIADIASLACGAFPFILTYHTGPMMRKGRRLPDSCIALYERFVLPAVAKRADAVICTSGYVKKTVFPAFIDKTVIISPGVDTHLFTPGKQRCAAAALFVGSLKKAERYKGLDILLRAIPIIRKRIPLILLTVVGDGDHADEYQRLCNDLRITGNVAFKGSLRGNALVKEYQNASLVVHPSSFDSFPLVLLEAMACGIPVVSTTVGGIPEIITHGKTGLLVPPNNPQLLAEAIVSILSSKTLAARYKRAAVETVQKKHGWSTKVAATKRVFTRIGKTI